MQNVMNYDIGRMCGLSIGIIHDNAVTEYLVILPLDSIV